MRRLRSRQRDIGNGVGHGNSSDRTERGVRNGKAILRQFAWPPSNEIGIYFKFLSVQRKRGAFSHLYQNIEK